MKWVNRGAWVATAGLIAVTLCCLAGALGAPFDTFRHLWPVWMCGGLVITLALAALRLAGRFMMALSASLLLAGLAFDPAPAGVTLAERELRLLTHNLWGSRRAARTVAHLAEQEDVDIVALQEAFPYIDTELADLLEAYPYVSACPSESTRIYSRIPILRSGCLSRRDARNPWTGLSIPALDMPPSAWAEFARPDGTRFTLVSVHLTWPDPLSSQNEQIERLGHEMDAHSAGDLIMLGDFNAAPPSYVLRHMEERWGVQRRTRHLASWPAPLPLVAIDHVFASEGWEAGNARRGPQTGSDHRPLLIDLARREP